MALTKRKKQTTIKDFRRHQTDTGSAAVQVALLSRAIEDLAKHLKKHPKDDHSRRGLLKMVSHRKRLLEYLSKTSEKEYAKVVKGLGLKK